MRRQAIKICRVRDLATARECGELGVDFVGLHAINWLSAGKVRKWRRISEELSAYYPSTTPVLVTKIKSLAALRKLVTSTCVNWIQFHVPLSADRVDHLVMNLRKATGFDVNAIAVVSAQSRNAHAAVRSHLGAGHLARFVLIDSSWRGGTGQASSDNALASIFGTVRDRLFLAGGLRVQNVAELARKYQSAGVDVQSGVELSRNKRPKDPVLLRQFVEEASGRCLSLAGSCPDRPLISLAVARLTPAREKMVLRKLLTTDVDAIHIDHSTGEVAPGFISDGHSVAKWLRQRAPCVPYHVHLFDMKSDCGADTLNWYLATNPNLRVAYLHIEGASSLNVRNLHRFSRVCETLQIGMGLAAHSSGFEPRSLAEGLNLASTFPVLDVSLITHSERHDLREYVSKDVPLFKVMAEWRHQLGRNIHLSLDRDMNVEKLNLFRPFHPSHVILGKLLHDAARPQTVIRRCRQMLVRPSAGRVDALEVQ